MQKIAREFNFGETTFVLPKNNPANTWSGASSHPRVELDFAGHPSVGTACALAMKQHVRLSEPIHDTGRQAARKGHCGAYLLRRTVGDTVEFVVLTLWESMCAVQEFAGQEINCAVVKLEARAIPSSFDDFVTHLEIIAGPNN